MIDLKDPGAGKLISIRSSAPVTGREFDAYCVRPERPRPPAVLLLPEMFGLTPAMKGSAAFFARHGYVAFVANVFWRAKHPEAYGYDDRGRETSQARIDVLDIDRAIADIDDAVTTLRSLAGTERVVTIGHCIGGRLAVVAASRLRLAGAVSYYGLGLSAYPAEMQAIAAPVQLHYGLADPHVPMSEIDAVASLIPGHSQTRLFRYPDAGHSFVNPNRPMYDPVKAEQAMLRTLALLDSVSAG